MPRRTALAVGAVFAAWSVLAACGGSERTLDQASFRDQLLDDSSLSPAQASCVADRAFARLDGEALGLLAEQGVAQADGPAASDYVRILVACLTGELPQSGG